MIKYKIIPYIRNKMTIPYMYNIPYTNNKL